MSKLNKYSDILWFFYLANLCKTLGKYYYATKSRTKWPQNECNPSFSTKCPFREHLMTFGRTPFHCQHIVWFTRRNILEVWSARYTSFMLTVALLCGFCVRQCDEVWWMSKVIISWTLRFHRSIVFWSDMTSRSYQNYAKFLEQRLLG